jgi:hypothetical protein
MKDGRIDLALRQQAQLGDMGPVRLRRDPRPAVISGIFKARPACHPIVLDVDHHRGGGRTASAVAWICASLKEAKAKFAETWRAWLPFKSA